MVLNILNNKLKINEIDKTSLNHYTHVSKLNVLLQRHIVKVAAIDFLWQYFDILRFKWILFTWPPPTYLAIYYLLENRTKSQHH